MFAARKQNFIGRLDFGGGKGCPWVFFPDFFSFMGDRRLAPLGFGDCVFRGYFSLPGYFLFYFPHYSVAHMATSLSLPFLRKHLGTHANEQMEQTNKRQKNNEYHNWSRKFFFFPKLCFRSKFFFHHSARVEHFLSVVLSLLPGLQRCVLFLES